MQIAFVDLKAILEELMIILIFGALMAVEITFILLHKLYHIF
jgi:hypothetical protein